MADNSIRIQGAQQNNLKNLDLALPLGELIVITGVSGSGKSSLAFDTVYAEGQRRYVETFSPYARQFLDRMDRPQVERIDGIPPSIAIDQTNPVRTSRSTVGTMTELNDHLKLLFARAAKLYCHGCGRPVESDTLHGILRQLMQAVGEEAPRLVVTFAIEVPHNFTNDEIKKVLAQQGYTRVHSEHDNHIEVVQDRVRLNKAHRGRLVEALEIALEKGHGKCAVYPLDENREPGQPWKFSSGLHCAHCDIHYREPQPNLFSFNSALGACDTCRGFGRTIGIDWNLVIPDDALSLRDGAIKPFRSGYSMECQEDLVRYGRKRGIDLDTPWKALDEKSKRWVIDGDGPWDGRTWYGAQAYFDFLESKAYKMHIRVMLSKYRSYDVCPTCRGARLKDEALDFRLGGKQEADAALDPALRFRHDGIGMPDERFRKLPGLNIHDLMQLPLERVRHFFENLFNDKRGRHSDEGRNPSRKLLDPGLRRDDDEGQHHSSQSAFSEFDLLLEEIRSRLSYLLDVGLGYLTLDRQSRTLSGGEVQRINLTTALGTSLVNTLFVLDEPSIGLHPRDIDRINGVLARLRDAGNSLLVVEHDPQIMLAANRILDIGPGPGERGGEVVFYGSPKQLLRNKTSLTAKYLKGELSVAEKPTHPSPLGRDDRGEGRGESDHIEILGAAEHNLKQIDVRIPLNRLVTLTGVSGSGKSTLVQEILFNALTKLKGNPEEIPGAHREIRGHEKIDGVVMLDQAPIGKSSRSNPVSYVGAWDGIRKQFAGTQLAKQRRYTPGTFSFNAGNGRCPVCNGSGFEHVEMQFLSDVYLRCPDCNGKRYRNQVLEVKVRGKSVADILELTVTEALAFFKEERDIHKALEPLQAVGLAYLRLGQPVPTLSGGEAQRLKLAGYLAKTGKQKKAGDKLLFLLDEPTTGLHFADIAVLLKALRRLLREGHSLLVIEHNLDVIAASDWLIDLGPEGGDGGGKLVCEGTPETVSAHKTSHTGKALRDYQVALDRLGRVSEPAKTKTGAAKTGAIEIVHAREHNLKNTSLAIPRGKFTVISGVSGSGKSTIAFDILFNEGQRRYLESLNAYARQFVQPASRPDVDAVFGIPPTVAIEQRTSRGGHKSTVGTLTEIHHFLRLLFVKLGIQYCPECQVPIEPQSRDAILAQLLHDYRGRKVVLMAPLIVNRKGIYKELAQWAGRKGYPILRVDGEPLPTDHWPQLDRYREHNIDLPLGELIVKPEHETELRRLLDEALDQGKGSVRVALIKRGGDWGEEQHFSTHRTCPDCGRGFDEPDPRLFSYNSRHGWCPSCYGTGTVLPGFDEAQSGEEGEWLDAPNADEAEPETCPSCEGARLNDEALAVYFHDWNIADYAAVPVDEAIPIFKALALSAREQAIGRDVVSEIVSRLAFLKEVGLGYLTLDRAAPTLSGGEAQRIRLAAQLGSNLRGVCYILDEPTIGLHPRDNTLLLNTLKKLKGKGNTIVVVEHDEETIRSAEHVIDIGPGAGVHGGHVIHTGSVGQLMKNRASLTGRFLANPLQHPLFEPRPRQKENALAIKGAALNNLKQVAITIPLQRLVCVSGVSGSGKSTLVREVVVKSLKSLFVRGRKKGRVANGHYHGCDRLDGWQAIQRVLEVDQTPIGKTPRSCPATYVGFWNDIRKLYAQTEDARIHGWDAGRFSFNTKEGRCETCQGQGMTRVEMSFLPDVKTLCESCGGARFNPETLAVKYRGKSIGDLLAMSVDEAVAFFEHHANIHHALQLLQDVGLGYLTLGQQSPTLSGGEAQRIKLVTELAKAKPNARTFTPTLYVLDEPTVGLHMADVEKLIRVLHRLVDAGHSAVVIEHNLDIIAEADWCIDMGPQGGDAGGEVVVEGTPNQLLKAWKRSETGKALRKLLINPAP
ncbi:MAG: excinuclease ABC subunit UvrA [Candidatus Thiodiazotropha sp. (ex Epidulcina cf. delphinae)]|nr:excinuclease ABC subunit UvrA [Candidatus Thiodiazotropha sp. (ex Epidulcina cf. delphinae)]